MTDSQFHAPGPRLLNESLQRPVDERWYTQIGGIVTGNTFIQPGGATRIAFRDACEIDALGIVLSANYSGATTYSYRLGAYRDSGSNTPGALIEDAGTVSIAQSATAGTKSITLSAPFACAPGESIWLVCAATHTAAGTLPNVFLQAGHLQPYSDYGLPSGIGFASGFAYSTGSGTALPSTFSLASPQEIQVLSVAVYAKVNV